MQSTRTKKATRPSPHRLISPRETPRPTTKARSKDTKHKTHRSICIAKASRNKRKENHNTRVPRFVAQKKE